ncbi:hypothetical protein BKA82DRAFT_4098530 [Pisolithus tinctorius]|nr:hypothetical protein BKA82DRAFT_4098530 [Pisolithus tinctorius]
MHWIFFSSRPHLPPVVAQFLPVSLLFIGSPSLEALGEQEFKEVKDNLLERTKNITVVSTLAVGAATSYLVSTVPTTYASWDKEWSYVFIAAASACAMLSTASGIGLIMYLGVATSENIHGVKGNWFKRWAVILLLMMPTLFLFASGGCIFVAWHIAVWNGSILWIKVLGTVPVVVGSLLVVIPVLCIPWLR